METPGHGKRCTNCLKNSFDCKLCGACKNTYYCSKLCQKQHWQIHKLSCSRNIHCGSNAMVEVKQSLIPNAGNGVFATKKYLKGEYVCYYHGIPKDISSINDFRYSIDYPFSKTKYVGITSIVDTAGVGQFINDYSMFELQERHRSEKWGIFSLSSDLINSDIDTYIKISNCGENVSFRPDNPFQFYASKDIEKGQELYYHYGVNYWLSLIQRTTDEPFTKLYCLLKQNSLSITQEKILIDGSSITPETMLQILHINEDGEIIRTLGLQNLSNYVKCQKIIELLK